MDRVICWLTSYDSAGHNRAIDNEVDLETYFAEAPAINPRAALIKGVIRGHRVEEIDDPLMQKIRYMDKLVDELARGHHPIQVACGQAIKDQMATSFRLR